ncbi:hypothetical protein HYW55_03665 [Candidatus Gottesmanbacteria bacterium]|nr:hypothetical protein [Candidatus Gottesmanbacteria bacterium]
MRNYLLDIDTSNSKKTIVRIVERGKEKIRFEKENTYSSQIVLPLIDKALKTENLTMSEISEIHVNPGPGSFTGLRVGIAIVNVLGWLWHIKVNGTFKPVYPHYE